MIAVMSVPIVFLFYIAVPWIWANTELEVHLKNVIPKEFVRDALAKNSTVTPEAVEPEPMPSEWENDASVCQVHSASLIEFTLSGNLIAVSANVFDALDLDDNPWIELITPGGIRMGGMAIKKQTTPSTVLVRRRMS